MHRLLNSVQGTGLTGPAQHHVIPRLLVTSLENALSRDITKFPIVHRGGYRLCHEDYFTKYTFEHHHSGLVTFIENDHENSRRLMCGQNR